jgi:hypothetical protein
VFRGGAGHIFEGELGLIGFVLPGAEDGEFFHNAFRGKGVGSFLRLDELGSFGFVFFEWPAVVRFHKPLRHRALRWF